MNAGDAIALVVAFFGAAGSFVVGRDSYRLRRRYDEDTRKRAEEEKAASAEALSYQRAQVINEQIVDGLRREIDRLQKELDDMRLLLRGAEQHSTELERKVAELQRTVDRMRRLMREHNIEVPEET